MNTSVKTKQFPFFCCKGAIYHLAKAMVMFLSEKITCYFYMKANLLLTDHITSLFFVAGELMRGSTPFSIIARKSQTHGLDLKRFSDESR